jgi:acyl-CoA thioesterase FadM
VLADVVGVWRGRLVRSGGHHGARRGRTSFTYDYEIVDEENRMVASARTVQVMFDYAASKPVPIPDDIREKMHKS